MRAAALDAGDFDGDGDVDYFDARSASDTARNLLTEVQRGNLVSAAEESKDVSGKSQTFLNEIRTGTFARSFKLARDADSTAVSATMTDGVLEVRVSKRKEAQARKIEVKAS